MFNYKKDMTKNNRNNSGIKTGFSNEKQKKFYLIIKAFKFGNVAIVAVIVIFFAKSFLGV